jgi:hypothetical protein
MISTFPLQQRFNHIPSLRPPGTPTRTPLRGLIAAAKERALPLSGKGSSETMTPECFMILVLMFSKQSCGIGLG